MTELLEFQRTLAQAVMQPMTARGNRMRGSSRKTQNGVALVKPNSRLSSFERLEIYHRSYWSRVLDAFSEDFPGVRALLGTKGFDRLRRRYLADCPSESFTMRDLGKHLAAWMERNATFGFKSAGASYGIARDMAKLEWAHIESFDAAEHERLNPADVATLTPESRLQIQPHLRLIEVEYEVDVLLVAIRKAAERRSSAERGAMRKRIAEARLCASSFGAASASAFPDGSSASRVYLAVHRFDLVVHYKRLDAEMFRLMSALAKGASIADASEFAYEGSTLGSDKCQEHVQNSFALFASLGWFCKAGRLESE